VILAAIVFGAIALVAVLLARRTSFPLRLALLGYVVLWLFLPLGYRWWGEGGALEADAARWYPLLVMAHAFGVAATVGVALAVSSPFAPAVERSRLTRFRMGSGPLQGMLLVGAAVILVVRLWQLRQAGGDFASLVALNISRERETLGGFTLVTAVASAYLSLALAVVASGGATTLGTRLVAWSCVTLVSLQNVLFGLRSFLLLPFLALFLLAGTSEPARRRRLWVSAWAAGVVALLVVPIAALILGVTRVRPEGGDGGAADVLEAFAELNPGDRARLFAAAANLKFDGFSTGATLLALDGAGGGGLRPLASALLSPVPRLLLPTKPVPISADGQQSGLPFVRAAQRFGAIEAGMVVPVSPAAVTVWELGWIGLALLVVANVLVLWLAEAWLRTGAILPAAFAFSLLSYPTFEFTMQAPSSLVRDLLRLGVSWALLVTTALVLGRHARAAPGGEPKA
jgi:hypothetical protein